MSMGWLCSLMHTPHNSHKNADASESPSRRKGWGLTTMSIYHSKQMQPSFTCLLHRLIISLEQKCSITIDNTPPAAINKSFDLKAIVADNNLSLGEAFNTLIKKAALAFHRPLAMQQSSQNMLCFLASVLCSTAERHKALLCVKKRKLTASMFAAYATSLAFPGKAENTKV